MSDNQLTLMPINDLLKEKKNFLIPAYQRGFRWTKRHVEELLNDIRDFQKESESKSKEAFYCLQPLVVTEMDSGWVLIDGQQRVTTIYLILTYLQSILELLGKKRYTLQYETRHDSENFLQTIDLSKKYKNIDYYHICEAYETIQKWFETQDGNYKIKFLQTLLNDDESGKNVKVIWYEVNETIDSIDVFTRLNMGKIPLTNSELIKALFLKSKNFKESEVTLQQIKIATEWDAIENTLQSDEFWYFMQNKAGAYSNRIEFILKLIADAEGDVSVPKFDPYYTFLVYNKRFSKSETKHDKEWMKVKEYFMTFEEWFKDRQLYHLVGYLVNEGTTIPEIKKISVDASKKAFRGRLKGLIFKNLFGIDLKTLDAEEKFREHISMKIADWEYGDNNIRSTLLLFNIATLLQNSASNFRFQFDSYKNKNELWDIEHIRSVKSEKPGRVDEQKKWLENVIEYFTGSSERDVQKQALVNLPDEDRLLCDRIINLLASNPFESAVFDALYEDLLRSFKEVDDGDVDNAIGNLALLDAHTNRSYQNAVFPIKRKRILDLDKTGRFVPNCTKNVFLKYYSPKISHMMYWTVADRENYKKAIIETLVAFFQSERGV